VLTGTRNADRELMSDNRRRAVLALQAKRQAVVQQVATDTGWDTDRVGMLLRQAKWDAEKAKAKIERCSAAFTVAEADMEGCYADRRQQAICFLMDALACNRTEATKLLAGAGGRVERVIAQLIRKHKALKRRRMKFAGEDAAGAAAHPATSGTEPTTDDLVEIVDEPSDYAVEATGLAEEYSVIPDVPVVSPIALEEAVDLGNGVDVRGLCGDDMLQQLLEAGEASDATTACGAGGSSSMICESAAEEELDVLHAVQAAEANEIECLAKVFEIGIVAAKNYYDNAVPARNGTVFAAAVFAIIAECVAEIIGYIDSRATRKLHKIKQRVMKHAENWKRCRGFYFAFARDRVIDPIGEAIASCLELADNREILPCSKKGCCAGRPPNVQPPGGKATGVSNDVVSSVVPSGGKAKVVYTGKAKA